MVMGKPYTINFPMTAEFPNSLTLCHGIFAFLTLFFLGHALDLCPTSPQAKHLIFFFLSHYVECLFGPLCTPLLCTPSREVTWFARVAACEGSLLVCTPCNRLSLHNLLHKLLHSPSPED